MYKIMDYIRWALTHIDASTIPAGAKLALPLDLCGAEPWHYLFGTVRKPTNAVTIQERWDNHYSKQADWALDKYKAATANFKPEEWATDCQGLLDAYMTYELGEEMDINCELNYKYWCTEKGTLNEISRDYVIGEALFMKSSQTGKMSHIGWICGFDADDRPLVVEARGLKYGVVVTKLANRAWTHRGLMTAKFDYTPETVQYPMEPIGLYVTVPNSCGPEYAAMQHALNMLGYTDDGGNTLAEDGVWGTKSAQAFGKILTAHSSPAEVPRPIERFLTQEGGYVLALYRTADLQNGGGA